MVYERILSKDEKAEDYMRYYFYENYGSHHGPIGDFKYKIVDKKNFDGIFIYDIEQIIDKNEYKSEEGYEKIFDTYYQTIQRITIIFTGSEFQVLSIIPPWKYNEDKHKVEFIDIKNYNKN